MNQSIKKSIIVVIVATVIIATGYLVFGRSDKAASDGSIVIGAIVGSTGQYGVVGESYIKGIQLARDVWIEQHPGSKVDVVIEDDGFEPKKGLAAYQKLVGINKVDALINMTSPTIDAIYSQVKQSGIPVAQGGEQGIEQVDDNVFQLLPGNIETEIALGKYMKDRGYKKVVAFYANSAAYVRTLNGFKKGYEGSVLDFSMNIEDRDYRTYVTKALATQPDAIFFATTPEHGANLVKLLREQSVKQYPYFFDANVQTGFEDYKRILGDMNVLNGSTAVVIRQKINSDFVSRYKAKYGEAPGVAADWAYDSFELLMRTHADNWGDWTRNIKKMSFEGAGGKVEFDEVGVRTPDFFIGTIKDGTLPQE